MSTTSRKLHTTTSPNTSHALKWPMEQAGLNPKHLSQQGGRLVVSVLNDSTTGAKPVARLVEACHRAIQYMESNQNAEAFLAFNDLNAVLNRYKWGPAVVGTMGEKSPLRAFYSIVERIGNPKDVQLEHFAISWIVDHIDGVQRIRRCHSTKCRKWFWAETTHQKYCEDNCRQWDASQGDSFKEKRRRYMKKYRSEEAERNARAKRLAKGKSK